MVHVQHPTAATTVIQASENLDAVGKGPVVWSSRSRLMIFSAEIKHSGTPTPGTVVAPA